MAYLPTLDNITGFAGGSLADQLRQNPRRKFIPPPPPNVDLETMGAKPPVTAVGPVGGGDAGPPFDQPKPNSGLNSVGKMLEHARQPAPLSTSLPTPPSDETVANIAVGGQTPSENVNTPQMRPTQPQYPSGPPPGMHLSQLASKMALSREMDRAPLNTPVTTDSYGLPQVGQTKPMSKKHAILMGILQGALAGGEVGGWRGAIGGAGVGGAAGAINPKLLYALERHQEQDQVQSDINREAANRAKVGQIGLQQSQTIENIAQAQRAARGTPHYIQKADGTWVATYDNQAIPVTEGGQPVEGRNPDAAVEESRRYHDLVIQQRKAALAAKDKDKVDFTTSGGAKYRVDQNTAARLRVMEEQNKKKPSPGKEAAIEAISENAAEKDALGRRKDTDEAIAKLQAQRDKLTHRSTPPAQEGGQWGWEEDMGMSMQNKASIAQIDKSIADLQKESDNQQRIAEAAAAKKRTAEAKAIAAGEKVDWEGTGQPQAESQPAATRKQFDLSSWKADHPSATAQQIAAKRKQYADQGYAIRE